MIGIYKITNQINNKSYIGQSTCIEKRWKKHIKVANSPSDPGYDYPLYRAIRKYGIDNFSFEIVEECLQEELNEKEYYWIKHYQTIDSGYNQKEGGYSASWQKITPEMLNDITNRLLNNESQIDIANMHNLSEETISRINWGKMWNRDDLLYPLQISKHSNKNHIEHICCDCGIVISNVSIRCRECEHKRRLANSPILQRFPTIQAQKELIMKILSSSFCAVGREYGVSDNTVRKWLAYFGIPKDKKLMIEWLQNN